MHVISLLELVIAVHVLAENKISTFCQQVFTGASKINFNVCTCFTRYSLTKLLTLYLLILVALKIRK